MVVNNPTAVVGLPGPVPGPPPVYVNGVQLHATPWDLSFEFHQLTPIGVTEQGVAQISQQVVARLVMSPQHAKAFLLGAQDVLTRWESQNGEITLPKIGQ